MGARLPFSPPIEIGNHKPVTCRPSPQSWSESSKLLWQVPRDQWTYQLVLRVATSYVVTTHGDTSVARAFNAALAVKKITLAVTGRGTFKEISGREALLLAIIRNRQTILRDDLTSSEMQADATVTASVDIPIDLSTLGVLPSHLGIIAPRSRETLDVEVEFNTAEDLQAVANGAALSMSGTAILQRRVTYPASKDSVNGYGLFVETTKTHKAITAGENTEDLAAGYPHLGLLLQCFAGTGGLGAVANVPSDSVLVDAKILMNDVEVYGPLTAAEIRAQMQQSCRWDAVADPITGLYYFDFTFRGRSEEKRRWQAAMKAQGAHTLQLVTTMLAPTGAAALITQCYMDGRAS